MTVRLSIIITTYNWPKALSHVLEALLPQLDATCEVLIADDGSGEETKVLIERAAKQSMVPILHIWQADKGFRAAKIRNKAIRAARGEYCIFLDGDCIPGKGFVRKHVDLRQPGYFVAGNRVLFSQNWTQGIEQTDQCFPILSPLRLFGYRIAGHINRILPAMTLPNGRWRCKKGFHWKGVKTCNLGVWREDLLKVNGFDEAFEGWGYEDSELVIRLLNSDIKHKSGRFSVPVFHLWHKENTRENHQQNLERLQQRIASKATRSLKGLF